MMGHAWKKYGVKPEAQPRISDREYWGVIYPLFTDGTIARLMETGKRQERISRMKQNNRVLQGKIRLLKRKISDFNRQGEKNGKREEL
jgi:hypothetical protein